MLERLPFSLNVAIPVASVSRSSTNSYMHGIHIVQGMQTAWNQVIKETDGMPLHNDVRVRSTLSSLYVASLW